MDAPGTKGRVSMLPGVATWRCCNGPGIMARGGHFDVLRWAWERRLLLRKKEILKIRQKTEEKGLALVPLRMYFRASWVKVEIAVARGKNTVDKRDDIRKKDAKRDLARISKLQY
eukprot:jgi/Tetstr1/431885/TSEL_021375.t1